jgi:hypothetical protein
MTGKITLISPPDVYVNRGFSIILINTTEAEQELISDWFSSHNLSKEISIYFYNNEQNIQWLITAFNMAHCRYVNVDNSTDQSNVLLSYMLSGDNCYYSTANNNTHEIFRLLNTSKLESVTEFLEKVIPIDNPETSEL